MRIGFRVGTQQELTAEDIQCPVITLPVVDVVDQHLDAYVLPSPDVATGIPPEEMALIDEEGTDLVLLYIRTIID